MGYCDEHSGVKVKLEELSKITDVLTETLKSINNKVVGTLIGVIMLLLASLVNLTINHYKSSRLGNQHSIQTQVAYKEIKDKYGKN